MKLKHTASLGMLLFALSQVGLAADLRPENYDSLFSAEEISNVDADFTLDGELAFDAVRPINPGHPNHPGNPGHHPGNPGHPNPGYPGHPNPGYPGHPNPGYPGHPNPGYPGHPNPGYPGHPNPGYPGHPNPGYSSVQCFAEDYYGNWYSSIGPRRQSRAVQQRALYNCSQSGNRCWAKGCRSY